jgi:N,N'-diacetyllegionaminate synthase
MEIIAEVGLAHDGSLSQAHAYVDACARAGVDTVKFQCHLGDPCTEWRVKPLYLPDLSRQGYFERTGFTAEEWGGLAAHCAATARMMVSYRPVEFLCSPFSVAAVALLAPLVKRWKVPSGRIADMALLDAIGKTGKPVLLSTGMGDLAELGHARTRLTARGCPVRLMQCVTAYPCPAEWVDLKLAAAWGGLSDHSGTPYIGIAAAALGCKVLEVHVCFSKQQGGLDVAASLTIEELDYMVKGVRFVEAAMKPLDKDLMAQELEPVRRVFMQQ